jgi:hypothetical protein
MCLEEHNITFSSSIYIFLEIESCPSKKIKTPLSAKAVNLILTHVLPLAKEARKADISAQSMRHIFNSKLIDGVLPTPDIIGVKERVVII